MQIHISFKSIFLDKKTLDTLYINEDIDIDEEDDDKKKKTKTQFGSFLTVLHSTMGYAEKFKKMKKFKSKKIIEEIEKKEKKNVKDNIFLNKNIVLYIKVLYCCRKWRMITEMKNHGNETQIIDQEEIEEAEEE